MLLALHGATYEVAASYVVEFVVKEMAPTAQRPHGISYALVFRPNDGEPFVRFDNAHAVERPGGRFVKASSLRPLASQRGRPRQALCLHDRQPTAR